MFFHLLSTLAAVAGSTAAAVASKDSYDYVIVGGGTAGSALATRLSLGLPGAKIILLEAGPAALDDVRINIPGLRGSLLGSSLDWNFTTVPQASLNGRTIDVNRGKVLGGSSAMNYLCYDRGSAHEYEAWAELGSPGWTWNNFFAAMTKSENFTGTDKDVRGRSGPIRNTYNRIIFDLLETWIPTLSRLGAPINDKGNMGGNPIGVMFQGTNIDETHYTRSYSANSYLPIAKTNLVVNTGAQVAKVQLEKCGDKLSATGVILVDGTEISATKEVILSAGSIQSPGLLELSGVGQSAVLKAAGIAPLLELPGVGENYQDHIRTSNTYRLREGVESYDQYVYNSTGQNATQELQKWFDGKVSLYDYTSSTYGFLTWNQINKDSQKNIVKLAEDVFGKSKNVVEKKLLEFLHDDSVPDVELLMEANYVGTLGYTGGNFLTLFSEVMHPFSRGSVHLDPKNPGGKPVIDPKYLSNEHDVRALMEAAKFSRRIANTEPLRSYWVTETEPSSAVETDEQWRDFIMKTANSFYHPVGTCALLPRKDGGVVDKDLRVYGTLNLRVVDNSIIPVILSGHIQTAAYGIAEIAAAKIIAADK